MKKINMVKPSYYNIFIKKTDGIVVYNTRSGKMLRCFEKNSNIIEKYLESDSIVSIEESKNVMELYRKGFMVDVDRNEIAEMESIEKEAVFDNYLKLIILPTEQCNFRCVYCYEQFKREKMKKRTQEAIVQYVKDNLEKYDGLIVNWFGGEPMEAMDIIEKLSTEFIMLCRKHHKAYNAGITTNGYNLTLENFRTLKKLHITEYQITLDGIPQVHDKQRIKKDGSGTFEKILQNLINIKTNVKSSAITIVLRTNFSKEMLEYLDEFQLLLDNSFSDDKRFVYFWQMVSDYGYVKDEGIRDIFATQDDYQFLIKKCTSRFANKYMFQLYGPNGGVCYALKRNVFVIDSEGGVRKCTCDLENTENYFGVIGDKFDVQKHEKWLERTITCNSKCYLCKKRPICHNRTCYKSQNCLTNLNCMEKVLDLIADDEQYYDILNGENEDVE